MPIAGDGEPDPGPVADPEFGRIAGGWSAWVATLPPELATKLVHLRPTSRPEPGLLVVEAASGYHWVADSCERADVRGKIESALRHWLGRPMTFQIPRPAEVPPPPRQAQRAAALRGEGLEDDPIVKLLVERFEARLVRVDVEDESPPGDE